MVLVLDMHIPVELRHEISSYCDRQSLVQLCLVDRTWGAEAQRVLYTSIRITVDSLSSASVTPRPSPLHTLSASPSKSALVRTLLIDQDEGPPMEVTNLVAQALMTMPNLVDLRLFADCPRARDCNMLLGKEVLRVLGSADICPFRLRALYFPAGAMHMPGTTVRDLVALHAPTLSILGIYAHDLIYDFTWVSKMVRNDCTLLKMDGPWLHVRPRQLSLTIRLDLEPEQKVAAVAGSLDADPAGRTCAAVTQLELQLRTLPSPHLSRIIAARFPQPLALQLILPRAQLVKPLDPTMVARVAEHIPGAWMLWILADDDQPTRDSTLSERLAMARALSSSGSNHVRDFMFPDQSSICRLPDDVPGVWHGDGGPFYV